MKKEHIISGNEEFQRIIFSTKPYKYKDYILYVEKVNENNYKFGFSVGKKIGHAVLRNKIKRRLREIVRKKDYSNGFNCIIIVGRNILIKTFDEMQQDLIDCFNKVNLIKEKEDAQKK